MNNNKSLKYFNCPFCDKTFKSYMGFWKHKNNKHKNVLHTNPINNKDIKFSNRLCKLCKKEFST